MNFRFILTFFTSALILVSAHDHSSKEEIAAEVDEKTIYYGSTVRFRNQQSRHHLYSMEASFGNRGHVVTAISSDSDMGSLFTIKSGSRLPVQTFSRPVKCGDVIRLEHASSRRNIVASGFASPVSSKMEVTAQGNNGETGDINDNFMIDCIGAKIGTELQGKIEFQLQHQQSSQYLTTSRKFTFNQHNCGFQCPIMNQLEVSCQRTKDSEVRWKIIGGVIIQKNEWSNESSRSYDPEDDGDETRSANNDDDDSYEDISPRRSDL